MTTVNTSNVLKIPHKTAQEIDRIAPEDRQAYVDFLEYIKVLYDKTADAFYSTP